MKVALINDFMPSTGIGNYAFSLFEELKKSQDIEMVFLNSGRHGIEKDGVSIINSPVSLPVLNKTLHNVLFFPKKIPKGFDLYHCSNQFIAGISKHSRPCIVSCMDVIPKAIPKGYPSTLRFFLDNAMKQIDGAEKIIAISEFTKLELIKHYKIAEGKISTVYLGFDEKIFKPRKKPFARKNLGIPLDGKIVLNVGSEEDRKNIPTLLKAIAIAKKSIPEIKLIRVGEQKQSTKQLIKKLDLEKNIQYFNKISLEKLGLFYNSADVFAFTSYYEGFGLPLLEAMASGIPSISTNRASIPEIAGNATETFDCFNEMDLAEKILKLSSDGKKSKILAKKGLLRSKKFSWKKCAKKTLKVYHEVLE